GASGTDGWTFSALLLFLSRRYQLPHQPIPSQHAPTLADPDKPRARNAHVRDARSSPDRPPRPGRHLADDRPAAWRRADRPGALLQQDLRPTGVGQGLDQNLAD